MKKTVSLVLGSGGARGLAHIGVVNCLCNHDLQIASIAGSSMGALVGGIYAAGKLDVYADWVKKLSRFEVFRLLDFAFQRAGLFRGERIIGVLKDLIGDSDIETLPIPYTAVCTDLYRQNEVWINRGPLFDAIRASIAIPIIFTPVDYKGSKLVDGGIINPVPIAPTLHDATDLTIAVNLCAKAELQFETQHQLLKTEANAHSDDAERTYAQAIAAFVMGSSRKQSRVKNEIGFIDMVFEVIDTMQNSVARLKMAAYTPDVVIDIPRNACAFYDFHRADEMIALGYQRAELVMEKVHEHAKLNRYKP